MRCAPRELLEFAHLYRRNLENTCGKDNGERNIKLDQAEFTDTGSLSRDSTFTAATPGATKDSVWLVG